MQRAIIGLTGLLAVTTVISAFAVGLAEPLPQRAQVGADRTAALSLLGYVQPVHEVAVSDRSCGMAKPADSLYPQSSRTGRLL